MLVIGLISGTSLDGIDAALVDIEPDGDMLRLAPREFVVVPYADALRDAAHALLPPEQGSTAAVCAANVELGQAFAAAALRVAEQAGVPISAVDLVASHGQTVFHQVAPGATRSTLQLAAPAEIAEQTGCTVVADFRPRDVAAGGQAAPLVPYLDAALFGGDGGYRASQNIGGMGNVTYLAPDHPVIAFDTGPGNVLIDEAVRLLTGGAARFDRDGRMAAAGVVDTELLEQWLEHPYFRAPPPKSTGREEWGVREATAYLAAARARGLPPDDTVATLTALTAASIARAYRDFLGRVDEVIVGGGGARNPTLLRMLREALPDAAVQPIDAWGVDADAKEAIAFALLGYTTLHGWPNNVPSATGARHPVVLGSITPGHNYHALLDHVRAAARTPPTRVAVDRVPLRPMEDSE